VIFNLKKLAFTKDTKNTIRIGSFNKIGYS